MNLLNLKNYQEDDVLKLLNLAIEFKNGRKEHFGFEKIVCNLFFEPSTRTHYSFEMAAKRLGCQTIEFNPDTSSMLKKETFYHTIKFFEAIEPDLLVIRSQEDNYYQQLNKIKIPIINGGDGQSSHPTQSLLDLMTIYEQFNTISNLKILIVGDIKHSRVAHTNIEILERLGNEVLLASPTNLQEKDLFFVDIDEVISDVDVVIMLRMQFERHKDNYEHQNYLENYGMNINRYQKLKEDAIILHPAPFNIGIEIEEAIIEAEKSRIYQQMNNGLYVRMALIYEILK